MSFVDCQGFVRQLPCHLQLAHLEQSTTSLQGERIEHLHASALEILSASSWEASQTSTPSQAPCLIIPPAFVAGIVTTITTWRAVFWTLCVIYSVFTIITWWTHPRDDAHQLKGRLDLETLRKFDFLGALLAVAGIAMFVASLTLANDAPQGWKTSYVIALLVIGFVLIATFVWWQSVFKYPLVPLNIWRDRNFALLNIILCLGFYGFVNNVFWLTLLWSVHHIPSSYHAYMSQATCRP